MFNVNNKVMKVEESKINACYYNSESCGGDVYFHNVKEQFLCENCIKEEESNSEEVNESGHAMDYLRDWD